MLDKNKLLMGVSLLAVVVSSYLLYLHYADEGSVICELGGFSCHTVNKSVYSTIDGTVNHLLGSSLDLPVPSALLSLLLFLFIFISSFLIYKDKISGGVLKVINILLYISLLYALFLIYVEAYVLNTWCVFCLVLDGLILISLLIVQGVEVKTKFED